MGRDPGTAGRGVQPCGAGGCGAVHHGMMELLAVFLLADSVSQAAILPELIIQIFHCLPPQRHSVWHNDSVQIDGSRARGQQHCHVCRRFVFQFPSDPMHADSCDSAASSPLRQPNAHLRVTNLARGRNIPAGRSTVRPRPSERGATNQHSQSKKPSVTACGLVVW